MDVGMLFQAGMLDNLINETNLHNIFLNCFYIKLHGVQITCFAVAFVPRESILPGDFLLKSSWDLTQKTFEHPIKSIKTPTVVDRPKMKNCYILYIEIDRLRKYV